MTTLNEQQNDKLTALTIDTNKSIIETNAKIDIMQASVYEFMKKFDEHKQEFHLHVVEDKKVSEKLDKVTNSNSRIYWLFGVIFLGVEMSAHAVEILNFFKG
jgi:hypothetical protein